MDVFCSQCCKRVSLLNDLENRLKNLKTNRYNIDYICYERYEILFHPDGVVIHWLYTHPKEDLGLELAL